MNNSLLLSALLAFSSQTSAAVDCKIFMVKKDKVVITQKKTCTPVADHSAEALKDIEVCLAKMKTANGKTILRVVLEGTRQERYDYRKLFIVEKNLSDVMTSGDDLSFTQDYVNPRDFTRMTYKIQTNTDLSTLDLNLELGRLTLKPHLDIKFECRE